MARNWFKKGQFNRIDDRSGFKVKADRTRQEWTGMIVAEESWEPRNSQDFVRGIPDKQSVENPRPEGTDNFGLAPLFAPTSWLVYLGTDKKYYPITALGNLIICIPPSSPTDPSAG